jgi:hypothetical protein
MSMKNSNDTIGEYRVTLGNYSNRTTGGSLSDHRNVFNFSNQGSVGTLKQWRR